MRNYTVKQVAKRLNISHWRVTQVYKAMAIQPIGYYRNSPLFSAEQVKQMKQRNTKPGPRAEARR
jgi:hypothetical protein